MRFACDCMLGRLAKWLRALGFDTFYDMNAKRHLLLRLAREEKRTVLTRAHDFETLKDIPPFFLLKSSSPKEQLKEVFKKWPQLKKTQQLFSRCLVCNKLIEKLHKESAIGKIPERIWQSFEQFYQCPSCQRIYWGGGHVQRLSKILKI